MAQLKNSTLIYDTEEIDNYVVQDYTSKDFSKLYDQLEDFPSELFDKMLIQDNDKLERIAYELYGNEDYWDILLLINNKSPLFSMSYDTDYIFNVKNDKLTTFIESLSNGIYGEENIDIFTDTYLAETSEQSQYERLQFFNNNIINELELENESYRELTYVKPAYFQEFLRLAYDKGLI